MKENSLLPFWGIPGILYHLFLVMFFGYAGFSLFLLLREYRKNRVPSKKGQIACIGIGTLIGFIGGSTNYILWYDIPVPPFLNILVSMYVFLTAYAILRYNFLDIEVIVKKTVIFAGLFVSLFTVFAGITFVLPQLFKNFLDNRWLSLIASFVVIILAYRPIERFLINSTDKYLFQKKYDYKELLKTFPDKIMTVLDLNALGALTVNKLTDTIKLQGAALLLKNENNETFEMIASAGLLSKDDFNQTDNDQLQANTKETGYYICSSGDPGELAIALQYAETVLGMIILGGKRSDEEFTQDDIAILLALTKTLSVAITNAQLVAKLSTTQTQAAQREKMAIVGTLSAGINHEICHPLGTIRGQCQLFLLNDEDGIHDKEDPKKINEKAKEIMKKVIKEADKATDITRRLSAFSKPSKGEIEDNVKVRNELNEVIAIITHEFEINNIKIRIDIPEDLPPIIADRKQLQEVFFNLIQNAAQAIENGGFIDIKASQKGQVVHIDIRDNGSGMSNDQLKQIWNPFFTTKEPGKGTGLGLFIVKQIIERNNGQISVTSEAEKGTTFNLSFRCK